MIDLKSYREALKNNTGDADSISNIAYQLIDEIEDLEEEIENLKVKAVPKYRVLQHKPTSLATMMVIYGATWSEATEALDLWKTRSLDTSLTYSIEQEDYGADYGLGYK